jgi:hypothetical protein
MLLTVTSRRGGRTRLIKIHSQTEHHLGKSTPFYISSIMPRQLAEAAADENAWRRVFQCLSNLRTIVGAPNFISRIRNVYSDTAALGNSTAAT